METPHAGFALKWGRSANGARRLSAERSAHLKGSSSVGLESVTMRVLLIGGSGFIGPHVAGALDRLGHEVVIFHRGKEPAPREILGDRRKLTDHASALRAAAPDVVVDLILSSGTQARALMTVFRGASGRVVALSSCDVYRACGVLHGSESGPLEPLPLTESSRLRTVLQTYPPERVKMLQQVFGWLDEEYDKIPVEREILGDPDLPGTVLRLPMVYGPGDPLHRFFPTLKRMDDRRPAILFEEKLAKASPYFRTAAATLKRRPTTQKPRHPRRKMLKVFLRALRVLRSTSHLFTSLKACATSQIIRTSRARSWNEVGKNRSWPSSGEETRCA